MLRELQSQAHVLTLTRRLLRLFLAGVTVGALVLPLAARVAGPPESPDHESHPLAHRSLPEGGTTKVTRPLPAEALAKAGAQKSPDQVPRFEISFAASARSEPVTGRVYVAISRDNQRPPIQQVGPTGVPLFGKRVEALAPGQATVLDASVLGHPVQSLRDLPPGEYWVQPFVNVYTKFARADGHTVWLHMDQWEGQQWNRSPGNLYGDPVKVRFDGTGTAPVRLVCDKVIPPVQPPADSEYVKHIKFESAILTKWWGHPIYLGATVLLPKDYDKHPEAQYPVNYVQGHFSTRAPGGFGTGRDFDKFWLADDTPRFLYVTLQHPSPYYDDSYGVNSANNGPYGDAIMQELIPAVEKQFRAIREPWARVLTGGSTGGWIAVAHQVFYPDFYGGTFASCPDAVDFRAHQIVNVYDDGNAYWIEKGWTKVERPNRRRPDGNVEEMMKDENWYELVVGDRIALRRSVGHLGGDVRARRRRRVPEADLGQAQRTDRQGGRRLLEDALRPPLHPREQLGDPGSEAGREAAHLHRRHGLVLLEQRGAHDGVVPGADLEPAVRRGGGLPAPGAALLGAARRGPAPEAGRAGREDGAERGGSEVVAVLIEADGHYVFVELLSNS